MCTYRTFKSRYPFPSRTELAMQLPASILTDVHYHLAYFYYSALSLEYISEAGIVPSPDAEKEDSERIIIDALQRALLLPVRE